MPPYLHRRLHIPQEALDAIPALYANDKAQTPISDVVIHLHLSLGSADWWIAEYDGDDLFFGFVNLGDDWCAEWGYISFQELRTSVLSLHVTQVDTGKLLGYCPLFVLWDKHWQPKPFREVQWRKHARHSASEGGQASPEPSKGGQS